MPKTDADLKAAFAGESQANRKYLAFAKKAEEEGLVQIARLFRAAAEGETVHAYNHLTVAGGIGTSAENLRAAVESEANEYRSMYPQFVSAAESEGDTEARRTFLWAKQVEEVHERLYLEALHAVKEGSDLPQVDYYVCQRCGNTLKDNPPERCPICGAPASEFSKTA